MHFTSNTIINNRFKLLRSIGRGSFGEVWLAEDTILGINLAVKIYIALDSRGLEEFKNEFKNVRHLNHPNLLRPDYYDHSENSPYLVMSYCPDTLGNKVGKMSEPDIWTLIKDVSAGLEYLHKMDIVHRDIKPDNVLKTEQGTYVISDFGLSQKMRSTLRRASARNNANKDSMSGTVGYMAPEMFSAKPNAVKATDIWALGATIYEVATGEMPFCGQGGVMELHGAELPDLPTNYGATLSDLMHRCLAKDPWDRPTAKEINEIAHSVLPENNEIPKVSNTTTYQECQKYKDEITRLNNKISEIEKVNSSSDVGKLRKGKKKFKIAFWVLFPIFILSVLFLLYSIGSIVNDYEDALYNQYQRLEAAETVISEVDNICSNGTNISTESFANWTSSNHTHNSRDYYEYSINGYQDDVVSFDYSVDSESYDHFKAYIIHNGDQKLLKDISGSNKKGAVSYQLPSTGEYTLLVEFNKDHSVHSGRDMVTVSDVFINRSSIGAIARRIAEYQSTKESLSDYSVDEVMVVEEAVVDSLDDYWIADTVAAAE